MKHRHGVPLETAEDEAIAAAVDAYEQNCERLGRAHSATPHIEIVRSAELTANGEYLVVIRD